MHLCQGNWVVIGRAVVYYARAAHTFNAEIKCPHYTQSKIRIRAIIKSLLLPQDAVHSAGPDSRVVLNVATDCMLSFITSRLQL